MEQAILEKERRVENVLLWGEKVYKLISKLNAPDARHVDGRKFDRIMLGGKTLYFIDKGTGDIYGAKSSFQHNPRRWYGTLDTVDEFDWVAKLPYQGTSLNIKWNDREASIVKNYKRRGRPKKLVTP